MYSFACRYDYRHCEYYNTDTDKLLSFPCSYDYRHCERYSTDTDKL